MSKREWTNVRTISVVTEPEPEGPIIKLGVGEKEIKDVVYITAEEISHIRVDEKGRYEADFRLEEKMGIHGKFAYIFDTPMKCKIENKTLCCSKRDK